MKKYLPRFIKKIIIWFLQKYIIIEYIIKVVKYAINFYLASISQRVIPKRIESRVLMLTHSIEKGLSHEKIRYGFGLIVLEELMQSIELLTEKYQSYIYEDSTTNQSIKMGVTVIKNYVNLHKESDIDLDKCNDFLRKYRTYLEMNIAGTKILPEPANSQHSKTFEEVFNYRHSIRHYGNSVISLELIKKAIYSASKTPSSCNRQAWEVLIIKDQEFINKILKIQAGLNNYASNIQYLLVIVSDLRYYLSYMELNQGFIDCGMYSMSVLLQLQNHNIASCALNNSFTIQQEKSLRKIINLDKHFEFVMFIACGSFREFNKVPISHRLSKDLRII